MKRIDDIVINSRVRRLQEEIEAERRVLLELVEKWFFLRYVLQPKLQFEYEKIFGDLENEIDEKVTLCNKLERKINLFFVKINRGMKVNRQVWDFIEKSVENENPTKESPPPKPNPSIGFQTPSNNKYENNERLNQEITWMYRALVKQLHPDISGETDFFKKFWVPIQDAYNEKNFSKIRVFYKILIKNFGNFEFEEDILKKLDEELKEIKLMIGIERRVIERMLQQEPFVYEKNFTNQIWIEEHRKKLKEKICFLDKQIDFNKRLLEKINENLVD